MSGTKAILGGALLVACAGLLLARAVATQSLVAGDSVAYFLTARDVARFGRWRFDDGYRHFFETRSPLTGNRKILEMPEPDPRTGRITNPKPLGTGLLLAPFFLLAGGRDDFDLRHQIAAASGSLFWGMLGLYLLDRALGGAPLTIAAIGLATPLVYYLTIEPLMSHACSFFAASLFLLCWLRGWWLAAGLAGGLLAIVRYADAIYLLLPLVDRRWGLADRPKRAALFLAGLVPALVLQGWENLTLFGSPWATAYARQLAFVFPGRSLLYHLFDWHAGFFLLTPIALVALAGVLRFERKILALAFFLQWILLASLDPTDLEGAAFGNRLFIGALPFLAPGLAAILARLSPRRRVALVAAAIAVNVTLAALYCARIIPDPYHL